MAKSVEDVFVCRIAQLIETGEIIHYYPFFNVYVAERVMNGTLLYFYVDCLGEGLISIYNVTCDPVPGIAVIR